MGRAWIGAALGPLALALAACAPGDVALTRADLVARAAGTELHETQSLRVGQGQTVVYQLSCLNGTRIAGGSALIAGVTGLPGRAEDYSLTPKVEPHGNRVVAVVRHIGPAAPGPAPMVTVDFRARCVLPARS